MDSLPTLSIIIPVFDEEKSLPELRRRLAAALDAASVDYEVIAVNDGSRDGSMALLRRFHEEDSRWKVVELSRNFGHGSACTAGLEHAQGQAVVFLDADLQDPPEIIQEFVKRWRAGADVVYGRRTKRKESVVRQMVVRLFYRVMDLVSDVSMPVEAGMFSLLDRRVADRLRDLPERHRYIPGMRSWLGFRQESFPYERDQRAASMPTQTYAKLFGLATDAIFSFSIVPLRIATLMGVALSAGALAVGVRILYLKLFTDTPIIGWTSIMLAILLLGGMTLITLGIMGEYIGRIYDEVKRRPKFILRENVGFAPRP